LHLLPSRISPPPTKRGDIPPLTPMALGDMKACPVSAYFQKLSIYSKSFWEPWILTEIMIMTSLINNIHLDISHKVIGIKRCHHGMSV
jgi:hypothetical protein